MTAPATTPRAAMIFAAGLGTRMGALTRTRPKPLIPVAGRALIDGALALLTEAGISRVVVNIHAHPEQMRRHLAHVAPPALISEELELLETGGGLLRALPLLAANPVLTLNADTVWTGPNPLDALARGWRPGMGALLCLAPRARALSHAGPGDFFLRPDARLERRGSAPEAPFVYTGAQMVDTEALAGFAPGAFSLNAVWDRLLAEGRLFGLVHAGGWVDVGRPEGIARAEAELARVAAP